MRHFVMLFCALYLSGSHWMLLQTSAWTGMLIARSQDGSFVEAMKTTFDGDHPCSMCKVVSKGQAEEKKSEVPTVEKVQDVKLVVMEGAHLPLPVCVGLAVWPQVSVDGARRSDAPPTPPPLA